MIKFASLTDLICFSISKVEENFNPVTEGLNERQSHCAYRVRFRTKKTFKMQVLKLERKIKKHQLNLLLLID